MTFSYDPSLDTDTDIVRFLLQDTVSTGHELENEEINFWITSSGSAPAAAIIIARSMYARYGKQVDRAVGDLKISYSTRAKFWGQILGQVITAANSLSPAQIYVGGISKAEILVDRENSDLVQPRVSMDMHQIGNPRNHLINGGPENE